MLSVLPLGSVGDQGWGGGKTACRDIVDSPTCPSSHGFRRVEGGTLNNKMYIIYIMVSICWGIVWPLNISICWLLLP